MTTSHVHDFHEYGDGEGMEPDAPAAVCSCGAWLDEDFGLHLEPNHCLTEEPEQLVYVGTPDGSNGYEIPASELDAIMRANRKASE